NEYASGLTALYQLKNIQTVLAAVDYLNHQQFELNMNAVKEGLAEVCTITGLRGRWEKIADKPLIIADTGHNVQGIQAVVQQIGLTDAKTVHIIIGMVNDKDINGVLDILPTSALYYFTNADVKRALPSNELQQMATKYGLRGNAYSTVTLAIRDAKANASEDDLILITGSNFVVGEALALI
ncbi:MAG: bifunctional folylpolyglutamate synthase/dihydrofolate synthase, partial [Ignavibacteria bacterium]|nr:bifunctional folylpolyglutamate synthase/dihydrofolate synthase [Ignavibacteria bacterium]